MCFKNLFYFIKFLGVMNFPMQGKTTFFTPYFKFDDYYYYEKMNIIMS